MTNVGFATLSVIPSFEGFKSKLEQGTGSALTSAGTAGGTKFGDAAGKSAGSRFGSLFKSAAKASLIGLAGAGALAVKFGSDAVSAASDLEESTNKVAQVFGKSSAEVFKFTKTAADALGQTNTQAREAASTFGIFGSAAGLADRKNAKFAKRMTVLASDLASFNNTRPEDAVQALGAALRGESEPIRAYGVLLDEATLKAEALALGILAPVKDEAKIKGYQVAVLEGQKNLNEALKEGGKSSLEYLKAEANLGTARDRLQKATEGTIPPLTQQQKLLAAQSQIFKQTEVAQGDFARTSDGLANQQRRLSARFEDAKASLGKGLLPIMTDAADFLLDKGIPAFEDFSKWFRKEGIPQLKRFGNFLKDEVVPKIQTAADAAKDLVGAFNDMPSWAKKLAIGGGATAFAATKLVGANPLGALRGATRATPMYVKVVGGSPLASDRPGSNDKGGGNDFFGNLFKAAIAFEIGNAVSDALPKAGNPYGQGGFLDKAGVGRNDVMDSFKRNSRWNPFADEPEKIDKTKLALEKVQKQIDINRVAHDKFLTSVDKTPKQVYVDFQSRGYQLLLDQIEAIKDASAGGIANTPSEATPRGFGSDAGVFAGANVNITANDSRDIVREGRKAQRRAAAGGFGV